MRSGELIVLESFSSFSLGDSSPCEVNDARGGMNSLCFALNLITLSLLILVYTRELGQEICFLLCALFPSSFPASSHPGER